jgi:hypothetical protein
MRVGEILVDLGHASPPQVRTALTRQRQRGGHIGTILVAMGAITVDQLFAALQVQRRKEVADCEHTLEHSQAEYGPMHQNTSLAHYDLARALCDAGRAADAVPHAKAAFTGFVASEGYYGNRSRSAARLLFEARAIAKSKRLEAVPPIATRHAPPYRLH